MTEVGVERLGAGHSQEDSAQRHQADEAVADDEHGAVERIESEEDHRVHDDMQDADDGDCHEPDAHHRPEEGGDLGGAPRLDEGQDEDRQRNDVRVEVRSGDLQEFDGREHRERRSDDRVAVEQRRRDDAEEYDEAGRSRRAAHGERHERERPALSVVVGTDQEDHILERDDDEQRPEDQ